MYKIQLAILSILFFSCDNQKPSTELKKIEIDDCLEYDINIVNNNERFAYCYLNQLFDELCTDSLIHIKTNILRIIKFDSKGSYIITIQEKNNCIRFTQKKSDYKFFNLIDRENEKKISLFKNIEYTISKKAIYFSTFNEISERVENMINVSEKFNDDHFFIIEFFVNGKYNNYKTSGLNDYKIQNYLLTIK